MIEIIRNFNKNKNIFKIFLMLKKIKKPLIKEYYI